jgi:filamentous hemagglutinin
VSGATVSITDNAQQQVLTGKTAGETIAALNTNTASSQQGVQKYDPEEMRKQVEAAQSIKGAAINAMKVLTDIAYYRKMVEEKKLIKVECSATELQCINDPSLLTRKPATREEFAANLDKNTALGINGILNDEKRAAELAYQNVPRIFNKDTGKDEKPKTIYLMLDKTANNAVSEVLAVAYEKIVTSVAEKSYDAANFLGFTKAQETYAELLVSRGQSGIMSFGHSGGTLGQEGALIITANRPDESGVMFTNPNLKVHGFGGAANVKAYTEAAAKIINDPKNNEYITFNYFANDPVSTSRLSGGNPGSWTIADLMNVINSDTSMHSCGGTGNNGCTQVETPVPGGPQGTPEGNAKLIKYQGGKRVDDNPIGRDKKGVAQ